MNSIAAKASIDLQILQETSEPALAQASRSTDLLRLEIIADEARFLELAPHWDGLLERSATRSPFLRWDWVSLWWEEYRGQFQLAIS